MTKIAHLILSHRQPFQLARLVTRLRHPDATIFVHIDKNCDLKPFRDALAGQRDTVFIEDRIRIQWGGFSMVEATLRSVKEIRAFGTDYDFINLLSESDYPLTRPGEFHAFLSKHRDRSFIEFDHPGSPWWQEAQAKVFRYHLVDYRFPGKHTLEKIINYVAPKRRFPMEATFVGRSQWFTLCLKHATYIEQFVKNHPAWIRYFRYTWGSDEIFFHSILVNSHHSSELINDNLRYIDWSENKPSPKILTQADVLPMVDSKKFYARKFDMDVDSKILDDLDRLIDKAK